MFFSKHNENITYINHYSGLLEVEGKGVLSLEDTELRYEQGKNWAKEYDTLSVTEGINGIGEGYLEFFSHIDCLILSRTVETVAASPELLKDWRKRKVLICGEYANPLPKDFYVGCTIEDFAKIFNERVREQILSNETLKRFLEISNERLSDHDRNKN